jgi:hypothetical protein
VLEPPGKKARVNKQDDYSDPDGDIPPMSQLQFGEHTLDAEYRMSMPPFYNTATIIATFLGQNEDHPGQEEWVEMVFGMSENGDSSESDSDWKADGSARDDESSSSESDTGSESDDSGSDDSGSDGSESEEIPSVWPCYSLPPWKPS